MHQAHLRHAAYYEKVARAANLLYSKGHEAADRALIVFDNEWPNIRAGQTWCAQQRLEDSGCAQLCSAYCDAARLCLFLRQQVSEHISWLQTAVGAAVCLKNRQAEADHLNDLGVTYSRLGESRRAVRHYIRSLALGA